VTPREAQQGTRWVLDSGRIKSELGELWTVGPAYPYTPVCLAWELER
jgi:hypothetical protein